MAKAVGIDLGTTNSVVAVMEGGKPTVIESERVAVPAGAWESVTWATNVEVPGAVGVPEITPSAPRVRPGGSDPDKIPFRSCSKTRCWCVWSTCSDIIWPLGSVQYHLYEGLDQQGVARCALAGRICRDR